MDVPEDIKVNARLLASRLASDLYPQISDEVRKPINFIIFESVAQALMAERERAAKIAESRMPATQDTRDDKICAALQRAAAAIRRGTA